VENDNVLPNIPTWVNAAAVNLWAPMVIQLNDGSFVLYYSATAAANTAAHCVGAATSKTIRGPYTPLQATIACPISQGGAIDPAGHHHPDGSIYVVYKIDGNSLGHGGSCNNGVAPIVSTPIMLQKMAADGVTPVGSPVQILDRDAGDGPLVEAPSLINVNGVFFLFFSSGCYADTSYDLSYATATSVTGAVHQGARADGAAPSNGQIWVACPRERDLCEGWLEGRVPRVFGGGYQRRARDVDWDSDFQRCHSDTLV
jgi:beta-xylosidase